MENIQLVSICKGFEGRALRGNGWWRRASLSWGGVLGFVRGWVQVLFCLRSLVCWIPSSVIWDLCVLRVTVAGA